MSKTISIHSFRGGTGKSNISANLSYLLAAAGKKVCVVDTDIQSPGIHIPLGLKNPSVNSLNSYLWGNSTIEDVVVDVSGKVGLAPGKLFLIPCSISMASITRILKEGYDVSLLNKGFRDICACLNLDYLIIDTHPGLNEETLLSIAISDGLFIILRPDQQDFQGTSVTVEVAKKLKVQNLHLIVNKALAYHDPQKIKEQVEHVYNCPVAAVLPLNDKMAELGSSGLFTRQHPKDKWSLGLKEITRIVLDKI